MFLHNDWQSVGSIYKAGWLWWYACSVLIKEVSEFRMSETVERLSMCFAFSFRYQTCSIFIFQYLYVE